MMKLRQIPNFLCVVMPALTWLSACGSEDDSANPGAGAGGMSSEHGGSGGATAGNGGNVNAGKGGQENSAAGSEQGGEGGSGNDNGAGGEAGADVVGGGASGHAGSAGTGGTSGSAGQGGGTAGGGTVGGGAGTGGSAGHGGNTAGSGGSGGSIAVDPVQSNIDTIVFIYAENRSFDNLYGNFPGAHNLSEVVDSNGNPTAAYVPQKDRDGVTVLPKLPKTWKGATVTGNSIQVPVDFTDNLPNKPFSIETGFVAAGGSALTTADVTNDLAHRFFENIMEINGGTNDMFGAWVDAGGLTMGHFDYSNSAMYKLAQQYVLADNFFEGAFGGSFLNHQYLICACAPSLPASFIASNLPSINVLGANNAKDVPQLAQASNSPASALDGPPVFKTGNVAPLDYFGPGDGYRAVNTMQAPFQPSGNAPVANAVDLRYANAAAATTVPPQTQTTIGDQLSQKGVSWAWYAGAWDAALADGMQASTVTRTVIYAPSTPRGNPDFQPHHQPFNYYAQFDPATHAAERTEHLRDYTRLVTDISAGTLPHVVYYKPQGNNNQHPGYANADDGDAHIADLVDKLKAGSQWAHMVIVITYDEYGGQWDHVAPPKGDKYGPGSRIPALIISPFAKKGTVDHTQYDTASISRLIARRFALATLPGVAARDQALVTNGGTKMGDLSEALTLP